jgi:hypothetical protein
MDLGEWSDVDWIGLAKDRNRWRALVNAVMNFGFHEMLGNYRVVLSSIPFCVFRMVPVRYGLYLCVPYGSCEVRTVSVCSVWFL